MTPTTELAAAPTDARLDDDRLSLLSVLDRHGVQHVLLGDPAGGPSVVIAPYARNLDRTIAALEDLGASLRVPGRTATLPLPVEQLRARRDHVWTLATPHGDLQLSTVGPDGRRYGELLLDTVSWQVRPGLVVELAA